jgi:hypothetical protein
MHLRSEQFSVVPLLSTCDLSNLHFVEQRCVLSTAVCSSVWIRIVYHARRRSPHILQLPAYSQGRIKSQRWITIMATV